ncbi:lysine--tRNA ligase [Kallipyga massiliensis]|uniref:lysine--tRNA ligase n=1 Tax=Kallipyga massiliensis TaxID=1472764 RepID=UPI0026EEB15C|nr:lysine--tRNA ligase [Kallipyga massiliensis]
MARKDLTDNELIRIRIDKLNQLKKENKNPHEITKFTVTAHNDDLVDRFEDYEGKEVTIAGRILAKRGHGKISFMDVQDGFGKIQIIARFNEMDDFSVIDLLDIGDIIGVSGLVVESDRGEKSIAAKTITLLTKSIRPLPEKFHGLKDPDLRYRQRYVDLIMNPEVKDVFLKRSVIISSIREFLDGRGFLEVETPILNTIVGGANARPFITHHNSLDIDMYLRIANELYLKRLIVGGFDRVYEMGRMFRNEGMDATHNPEYTAMELYQAYTDYEGMMEITENMIAYVCEKIHGTTKIDYQGREVDFKPPWKRITMTQAVKEYAGIDFSQVRDDQEARALADRHEIPYEKTDGWGKILSRFFDEYAEDKMVQPTFVYEYPVEISPLAKRSPQDPEMTERFEAFVCGWEIANAFSELNDAQDQHQRFLHQVELRESGDDEAGMMDEDFINALEIGLPPTGGLGIGIDRMIMVLTNQSSIRDVLLFPTMKPLGLGNGGKKEDGQSEGMDIPYLKAEDLDFSKVQVEPLFEEMVDFDSFSKMDLRVVKVKDCQEVPKSKKLLLFKLDDGSQEGRTILSGIRDNYAPEDLVGKTLLAICNIPPRKMMGVDSEGMLLSAIHEEEGEEKLHLIMLDPRIPAGAKLY